MFGNNICDKWDEILGFQSFFEFQSFSKWLNDQNEMEEIPVDEKLSLNFNEKWYLRTSDNTKWRLIFPFDLPYTGSFRCLSKLDRCPWNEIYGWSNKKSLCKFKNIDDFNVFYAWIEEQVKLQQSKIIHLEEWPDNTIKSKYYQHLDTGSFWKLTWPDYPLEPSFKKISEDHLYD